MAFMGPWPCERSRWPLENVLWTFVPEQKGFSPPDRPAPQEWEGFSF